MKVKSSPAKRSPLQNGAPIPDDNFTLAEYDDNRALALQIADPDFSPIAKSFQLPEGWVVEERPRVNTPHRHIDRTFTEIETGRQFRSLISVQRYIAGEEPVIPDRRKGENRPFNPRLYESSNYVNGEYESPVRRRTAGWKGGCREYENSMQIVTRNAGYTTDGSAYNLPDGWVVEHIPRSNIKYSSTTDRYFIDPETGYRFRSLRSAERYLAESGRRPTKSKNSGSRKKNTSDDDDDDDWDIELKRLVDGNTARKLQLSKANSSRKKLKSLAEVEDPMTNFARPPEKVKWVLGGPGKSLWNPFMGESEVPENIQQTWSKTFISSIEGRFNLYGY